VNWLLDAQLPRRLAHRLRAEGEDVLQTLDLPDGNRTTDLALLALAARVDRILVSKDADFAVSFRLHGQPRRLLLVATGNIANRPLEALYLAALPELRAAFSAPAFIELHAGRAATSALLVIHP
jgi:predicted nuclease of predicted toxin-antitoxin system